MDADLQKLPFRQYLRVLCFPVPVQRGVFHGESTLLFYGIQHVHEVSAGVSSVSFPLAKNDLVCDQTWILVTGVVSSHHLHDTGHRSNDVVFHHETDCGQDSAGNGAHEVVPLPL